MHLLYVDGVENSPNNFDHDPMTLTYYIGPWVCRAQTDGQTHNRCFGATENITSSAKVGGKNDVQIKSGDLAWLDNVLGIKIDMIWRCIKRMYTVFLLALLHDIMYLIPMWHCDT